MFEVSKLVLSTTLATGGASFNLKGEKPSDGYMVSVHPECCAMVSGTLSLANVEEFIFHNSKLLQDPQKYVGTWFDLGVTYLDISQHYDDRQAAIQQALEIGELAIWDVINSTEIRMENKYA